MSKLVIAKRYAEALFSLGKKQDQKQLEQYAHDLTLLVDTIKESKELRSVLYSPLFSVNEKSSVIKELSASLSIQGTILHFVLLLSEKKRLTFLESIKKVFNDLLDNEQNIKRGTFASAAILDENEQQNLVRELEQQLQSKLVLDFELVPSLIGGFVLRIGDKVIDASIRMQLTKLKDSIKRGEHSHAN